MGQPLRSAGAGMRKAVRRFATSPTGLTPAYCAIVSAQRSEIKFFRHVGDHGPTFEVGRSRNEEGCPPLRHQPDGADTRILRDRIGPEIGNKILPPRR